MSDPHRTTNGPPSSGRAEEHNLLSELLGSVPKPTAPQITTSSAGWSWSPISSGSPRCAGLLKRAHAKTARTGSCNPIAPSSELHRRRCPQAIRGCDTNEPGRRSRLMSTRQCSIGSPPTQQTKS